MTKDEIAAEEQNMKEYVRTAIHEAINKADLAKELTSWQKYRVVYTILKEIGYWEE